MTLIDNASTLELQNRNISLEVSSKMKLAKRMKDASWPLIGTTSAMVSRSAFKNTIKTNDIFTFLSEMASEVFRRSFCCCYFVVGKNANPPLKTKNSREKLTFKGAETHLELRSPIFGDNPLSTYMSEFPWNS